jgi:predicted RNase H-like HicB family nuclease
MTAKKQNPPNARKKKPLNNKPQSYLQCSVVIRQENRQYSSWCPELDIASCGSTIEEASQNLHDAIKCYLQTCSELGELPRMLQERGLKLVKADEPSSPTYLSGTRISIPFTDSPENISLVSA